MIVTKSTQHASILLQYRTWLIAFFQAFLIFAALVLAWLLRFDFSLPYRALLLSAAPLLIVIRLAAIGRFGLLHGWWRYTGVSDALDIVKAITLGSQSSSLCYAVSPWRHRVPENDLHPGSGTQHGPAGRCSTVLAYPD